MHRLSITGKKYNNDDDNDDDDDDDDGVDEGCRRLVPL